MTYDPIPDQWDQEAQQIEFMVANMREEIERALKRVRWLREGAAARRAHGQSAEG